MTKSKELVHLINRCGINVLGLFNYDNHKCYDTAAIDEVLQRCYRPMAHPVTGKLVRNSVVIRDLLRERDYLFDNDYEELYDAAVQIQAQVRGFQLRQAIAAVLKKERNDAAVTIQAVGRGYVLRGQRNDAAIIIQSMVRGGAIRYVLAKQTTAAIVIQSTTRRREAQMEFGNKRKAVILLQSKVRRRVAETEFGNKMKAVVVLQSKCRQRTAETEFRNVVTAVVLIQACGRRYLGVQEYNTKTDAARVVQRVAREFLAERQEERCRAIVPIQTFARRFLDRCREERIMTNAAVSIQTGARRFLENVRVRETNAAVRIQAVFLERRAVRRYRLKRRGAVRLQAAGRGFLQRRADEKELIAKTKVARIAQAIWKAKQLLAELKAEWEEEMKRVQELVKLWARVEEFQTRTAAKIIQRAYQKFKAKKLEEDAKLEEAVKNLRAKIALRKIRQALQDFSKKFKAEKERARAAEKERQAEELAAEEERKADELAEEKAKKEREAADEAAELAAELAEEAEKLAAERTKGQRIQQYSPDGFYFVQFGPNVVFMHTGRRKVDCINGRKRRVYRRKDSRETFKSKISYAKKQNGRLETAETIRQRKKQDKLRLRRLQGNQVQGNQAPGKKTVRFADELVSSVKEVPRYQKCYGGFEGWRQSANAITAYLKTIEGHRRFKSMLSNDTILDDGAPFLVFDDDEQSVLEPQEDQSVLEGAGTSGQSGRSTYSLAFDADDDDDDEEEPVVVETVLDVDEKEFYSYGRLVHPRSDWKGLGWMDPLEEIVAETVRDIDEEEFYSYGRLVHPSPDWVGLGWMEPV